MSMAEAQVAPPGASAGAILMILMEALEIDGEEFDAERVTRWIEMSMLLDTIDELRDLPDDALRPVVGKFWYLKVDGPPDFDSFIRRLNEAAAQETDPHQMRGLLAIAHALDQLPES